MQVANLSTRRSLAVTSERTWHDLKNCSTSSLLATRSSGSQYRPAENADLDGREAHPLSDTSDPWLLAHQCLVGYGIYGELDIRTKRASRWVTSAPGLRYTRPDRRQDHTSAKPHLVWFGCATGGAARSLW